MSHARVFSARGGGAKRHPRPWRYVGRGRCPCGATSCAHGPFGHGNPFSVEQNGPRCLILHAQYLARRLRTQPAFNAAIDELTDVDLICWCAPGRCHAEALARLAAIATGIPAVRRDLRLALLEVIVRELEAELAGVASGPA